MTEAEGGGECHRRRGRPRMNRSLEGGPSPRCYAPQCSPSDETAMVSILPEHLAVLSLIDLQGLEQEQAAAVLGVSRKTVWRDLHDARRKIADALVNGKTIEVAGCQQRLNGHCPWRNRGVCPKKDGGLCPKVIIPSRNYGEDTPGSPSG
jgi:predicted DNA-binding protein (UPF0251 family)